MLKNNALLLGKFLNYMPKIEKGMRWTSLNSRLHTYYGLIADKDWVPNIWIFSKQCAERFKDIGYCRSKIRKITFCVNNTMRSEVYMYIDVRCHAVLRPVELSQVNTLQYCVTNEHNGYVATTTASQTWTHTHTHIYTAQFNSS